MTVKAGLKTEEREHVFNNDTELKNIAKARGIKTLCFSFVVLSFVSVMFLPLVAQAQPTPLYARPSVNAASDDALAQMEIRLQEMERQMRDLTGRIEEQSYEINRLQNSNQMLEEQAKAALIVPKEPEKSPLALDLNPPQPMGMKTATPGGGTTLDTTAQYEKAFEYLKSNQYEQAQTEFEIFLNETPDHSLAPNAKYWLGETYYAQGEFKTAARVFAEGFQAFPNSSKSPDILLKLGMSLAEMGKKGDACIALSQLPVKFPAGPEGVLQRGEIEREKLACES